MTAFRHVGSLITNLNHVSFDDSGIR